MMNEQQNSQVDKIFREALQSIRTSLQQIFGEE